jgi:hypothetical protein
MEGTRRTEKDEFQQELGAARVTPSSKANVSTITLERNDIHEILKHEFALCTTMMIGDDRNFDGNSSDGRKIASTDIAVIPPPVDDHPRQKSTTT